jgi:ferredoxin-NADP reductase
MMNSLGNVFITPLAGIVFPSFSTGAVLYVTGKAETLFGEAARKLMARVSAVTTIYVTGFSFVENAMPIRERPSTGEDSPYCPPICYLSEEQPPEAPYEDIAISLVKTRVHNDTLATFTFEASCPVQIRPSQNAILDLSHFVRERASQLVDWTPSTFAESDDCVRTWTVSVPPTPTSPATFSLTIRLIKHGLTTPILHQLARKVDPSYGGKTMDVSSLGIVARLRGVGGTLPLPEPLAACDGGRRLLWIAGGIGLTPFLGLTRHVAQLARCTYGVWDVVLAISSREPEVMLSLVQEAYVGQEDTSELGAGDHDCLPVDLTFSIHLFTDRAPANLPRLPAPVSVTMHQGRIDDSGTFFESVAACEREPYICGPLPFVLNAIKSLSAAGVDPESVLRERFTY